MYPLRRKYHIYQYWMIFKNTFDISGFYYVYTKLERLEIKLIFEIESSIIQEIILQNYLSEYMIDSGT